MHKGSTGCQTQLEFSIKCLRFSFKIDQVGTEITFISFVQVCENFDDMNLKEELLRGIYAYGFEKPSAIQQRAIVPCIKVGTVIFYLKDLLNYKVNFYLRLLCLCRYFYLVVHCLSDLPFLSKRMYRRDKNPQNF